MLADVDEVLQVGARIRSSETRRSEERSKQIVESPKHRYSELIIHK